MATKTPSTRNDFYVYALFRETGIPFYIGKGQGNRWTFHEWDARRGSKGHKFAIIRQILGRGVELIRVKLHEDLTEAVAFEYESAMIVAIGRHPNGPLANLTDGGDGPTGLQHTPEAKVKMATAKLGRKLNPESIEKRSAAVRGKPRPDWVREKIAAKQRGIPRAKLTPEQIAHRSAKLRGSKRSPETKARMSTAQRGRKLSLEHIAKISAVQRGRKHTPEHIAKCVAKRIGQKRTPEAREKMHLKAIEREARKRLTVDPHNDRSEYLAGLRRVPATTSVA